MFFGLLRRLIFWLVLVGGLLAAIVGSLAMFWLSGSLPLEEGRMRVKGISASTDIIRDRFGIPHIKANNLADAMYSLGVVHAQDRLWQMEMGRRAIAGRLSEVAGTATLDTDKFLRGLGLENVAAQTIPQFDPVTRQVLDAYSAGVNHIIQTQSDSIDPLPPEFVLARLDPEPWQPKDSVGLTKGMALFLSGNFYDELMRARLLADLGKEKLIELYQPYPGEKLLDIPDELASLFQKPEVSHLIESNHRQILANLPFGYDAHNGSNNWAVDGTRTTSGRPLLANDPHLGLSIPSTWYFAHLETPEIKVIGATLPGVPGIVLGRTDRIAWAYTNTGPDTQDLYLERINPTNDNEYQTPTGWQSFESVDEIIQVKGEDPYVLKLRRTRHGPVLSDFWKNAQKAAPQGYALALRWTALETSDMTFQSGIKVLTASNWGQFREAMADYHAPQQSILYADVDGNIGFIAPAKVPIRHPDNKLKGTIPQPGWDPVYDWQGTIPFEELPQILNPSTGTLMTANARVVPDDYPYYINRDWADPERAQRIRDLLAERHTHSIESFKAIQTDHTSLFEPKFLPLLLESQPSSDLGIALRDLMQGWKGQMPADSNQPLIFHAWYRELVRRVLQDDLRGHFDDYWDFRGRFMLSILAHNAHWCDDIGTQAFESCQDQSSLAMDDATRYLEATYGNDPTQWRWGKAHHARMKHRPLSDVGPLHRLFGLDVEMGGGPFSPMQMRFSMKDKNFPFASIHGPGMRAIYDMAEPDRSLFIHTTGQSGNWLSPLYADFAPLWASGQFIPMTMDPNSFLISKRGHLELIPE